MTTFIRCRTLLHAWTDVSGTKEARVNKVQSILHGRRKAFRCIFCTTMRHEVWSTATGQLISREYVYPEGYKVAPGGKMSRDEYRMAYIKTVRPIADKRPVRRK